MRMTGTPSKNRTNSVDKSDKRSPLSNSRKSTKPKGSMGLDLLLIAIGTSLIGLGGLGYLFYQELIGSSKREVDRSAEAQARQIESKFTNVRQTVGGVASAARTLSQQQPRLKTLEAYQKLEVEGLQKAESLAGIGITQNENMLFPTAKPAVPYVWRDQSGLKLDVAGQPIPAGNANASDKLLSGNRPDIQNLPFYKATLTTGKESWTEPYSALGKTIVTYSAPINDGQKTIGVVNADVIASNLLPVTVSSPSSKSEIGFVVVSANGKIVTASDQFLAQSQNSAQNSAITEALNSLLQQSKTQSTGIAQVGGNLWAYRKIQGSDFLMIAALPEAAITNKLIMLVGGTALGISAILAIAILGFVNSLKKRLNPLTEECDRFLIQQGNSDLATTGKDEIEQLSLALKSTLQQAKAKEVRMRSAVPQSASSEDTSAAQVPQTSAETELMEAEVGDLLDVVSSMEEGDLTIEAQVNDRATGLVADTLNRLREKLVEIISSVLGTAKQVAQGASDLEELTRTVVLNTAEQAQSVAQGQALTEQVATIASRSAAQVNVANQSLQEVRDTVTSGQTAINTLTESISVLQTGSAQIVQRMKTLGEFVGLAEQFVQDQGQIASLTQVLALNATLVAARAAEQKDPKQFASVAREFESIAGQVNDLATQTNDGLTVLQQRTSQIQTVVTAIDVEVQNLSGLVAGFTTGVESSQSAFNSIQSATEEVVQIGQTITESSTEIADAAGSTASYISEISQLADRTANLTRSARQQAELMGNQAQQLLQGIQFFRLPDAASQIPTASVSTVTNSVATTSTTAASTDTAFNSLLSSPTEFTQDDDISAVPAIAIGAATAAIALTEQDLLAEHTEADIALPNKFAGNSGTLFSFDLESEQDRDFVPEPAILISEDEAADAFYNSINTEPELTDISVIEESLFADLRHEIYEELSLTDEDSQYIRDVEDVLSINTEHPKNFLDDPNEIEIIESSDDPMLDSATSSFLEDTTFGMPLPLSEEALANLPMSVDFSIPDLDDYEDFEIPKTSIESTLDDSNSFFDAGSIPQFEANESSINFDPAYTDQALVESSDYILGDNIFESNPLDENISEDLAANEFEDYNDYESSQSVNASFEARLGSLSNDAFTDTFDMSFDELPFDQALDEAFNDSLNDSFDRALDESLEALTYDELASSDPNNLFDVPSLTDSPFDNLDFQDNLADLPNVYPDEAADESLLENFVDQTEDSLSTNDSDLDESIDFLNSISFQSLEELVDPFDVNGDIQIDDSLDSGFAIAPELEIQETTMSDQSGDKSETAFPSMFDENVEDEFDDLIWESDASIPELSISDSFSLVDTKESLSQSDTSFSLLFDENMEDELENESDDSIWQSEAIASDPFTSNQSDLVDTEDDLPQTEALDFIDTLDTNILNSAFDMPEFSELIETDDALLDSTFNFDLSDDLGNSLDGEEEATIVSVDGLLSDAKLDVSSIFSTSNSLDNESEFSFEELLTVPEENNLDDDFSNTEGFVEEIAFDSGLIDFTEILETTSHTSTDASVFEEPAISEGLSDTAYPELSIDSMTPEIENIASEFVESTPDISLDFSDAWLEEISIDEDVNIDDLSIEYPSMDDVNSDLSTDSSYGFADNLLDSLMDESDEEFADLSLDLPDLSLSDWSSTSDPKIVETEVEDISAFESVDTKSVNAKSVNAKDEDSESEFDFSAFDDPLDDLNDSVVIAKAEIDDFLSGALVIEEFVDERAKLKKDETSPLESNSVESTDADAKTNNSITNDRG